MVLDIWEAFSYVFDNKAVYNTFKLFDAVNIKLLV